MEDFEKVAGDLLVEVELTYSCKDATVIHIILKLGPIMIVEGPEYVVHKFLHYSRTVSGSEWHYSGCVEPIYCFKGQDVL